MTTTTFAFWRQELHRPKKETSSKFLEIRKKQKEQYVHWKMHEFFPSQIYQMIALAKREQAKWCQGPRSLTSSPRDQPRGRGLAKPNNMHELMAGVGGDKTTKKQMIYSFNPTKAEWTGWCGKHITSYDGQIL